MDHIIDAKKKPLGRLASEIALRLQGKHNPSYAPNRMSGDRVILKNADKVGITGDKIESKEYFRHTGYMGHLKSLTLKQMFVKGPERVIREAVRRMLPKNSLNKKRLKNLIFEKND